MENQWVNSKWPVFAFVGLVLLVAAFVYLVQAVEPPRTPAVEVIEREHFGR